MVEGPTHHLTFIGVGCHLKHRLTPSVLLTSLVLVVISAFWDILLNPLSLGFHFGAVCWALR